MSDVIIFYKCLRLSPLSDIVDLTFASPFLEKKNVFFNVRPQSSGIKRVNLGEILRKVPRGA